MPERPEGAGERRDRTLADAEAKALGQQTSPKPKPLPEATPMSFSEATRKVLERFGVRHSVNGKDDK